MKKILPFIFALSFFLTYSSRAAAFGLPKFAPPLTLFAAQISTVIPIPSSTITPTFIPSPIPTATWVQQGLDEVIVPILLYHRIAVSPINSQFYVSPDKFEEQIRLLRLWEYTTITTQMLVEAITEGIELPPRPILITFDDGNLDNYITAFPIMQRFGYGGVLYISGNYLGTPEYLNADQIRVMALTGWEVGSHGMSHQDLTASGPHSLNYEIVDSRAFLEKKLGLPILSFAYPFGASDQGIYNKVYTAGYIVGMGIGSTSAQQDRNLFALSRIVIKGTYDLNQFAAFLPWQGDPNVLPADAPTPSP